MKMKPCYKSAICLDWANLTGRSLGIGFRRLFDQFSPKISCFVVECLTWRDAKRKPCLIPCIQRVALGVVALVFLTACLATGASSPIHSATASERKELEQWQIEFSVSGGFAGIRRSVELLSTGQLTVTDQKTNRQITIQVPEMEMKKIASLVTQAQPAQPTIRFSNCRDCFEYKITIQRDGERFSSWFNDLTLDNAELALLINTLTNLQERALSGQLNP